jgi:hypothetical protein
MNVQAGGARGKKLAAELHAAAEGLISLVERIDPESWSHVPGPTVWSIGKDAAHVAEAAVYHQWIVRVTIGEKVSSRRPAIERLELTTAMTPRQGVDLIRDRTDKGRALLAGLTGSRIERRVRGYRGVARNRESQRRGGRVAPQDEKARCRLRRCDGRRGPDRTRDRPGSRRPGDRTRVGLDRLHQLARHVRRISCLGDLDGHRRDAARRRGPIGVSWSRDCRMMDTCGDVRAIERDRVG